MERRYKNQIFTKAGNALAEEEEVDQGCHPVVEPVAVDLEDILQEAELGEYEVLCPDSRQALPAHDAEHMYASWSMDTLLPSSPSAAVMGFRGKFFSILTISNTETF